MKNSRTMCMLNGEFCEIKYNSDEDAAFITSGNVYQIVEESHAK